MSVTITEMKHFLYSPNSSSVAYKHDLPRLAQLGRSVLRVERGLEPLDAMTQTGHQGAH